MFAGPNGSGKTTLIRNLATEFSKRGLFRLHYYVNADDLFVQLGQSIGLSLATLGIELTSGQLSEQLELHGRLSRERIVAARLTLENGTIKAAGHCDSYLAAAIADVIRQELLRRQLSFTFETVMSHPSKVAFLAEARRANYRTYLYFVATESPYLNLLRVKNRAEIGGHSVPPDKILQRYDRSLQLLPEALQNSDRAFLFDNSREQSRLLAELHPDRTLELKVPVQELPDWYRDYVEGRFSK